MGVGSTAGNVVMLPSMFTSPPDAMRIVCVPVVKTGPLAERVVVPTSRLLPAAVASRSGPMVRTSSAGPAEMIGTMPGRPAPVLDTVDAITVSPWAVVPEQIVSQNSKKPRNNILVQTERFIREAWKVEEML